MGIDMGWVKIPNPPPVPRNWNEGLLARERGFGLRIVADHHHITLVLESDSAQ